MKLINISAYAASKSRNVNFKSAVPVFVQIAENSQNAKLVTDNALNKTFRIKTEYLLNNSLKRGKDPERDAVSDRLRNFFGSRVKDFNGRAAAFTCVDGGVKNGFLKPYFYFVTGSTMHSLENLRLEHKKAVYASHGCKPSYLETAKKRYYEKGKNLVLNAFSKFSPSEGYYPGFVVTFQPVKNTKGAVKDYKLINAEFKPAGSPENPRLSLFR